MTEKTPASASLPGPTVSRRSAIGAGAAGLAVMVSSRGISTLAQTRPAASAKATAPAAPAAKLAESDVAYRNGDTDIKAFLARPEPHTGSSAGVIVIHEIWGLTDHIRDVARRFARQGYVAVAPDLFTREGTPQLDPADKASMMKFLAGIPDRRVVADLQAALAYLKGPDVKAAAVGSVGFCMGGLYSYLLATQSGELAAAVEFYGRIVYAEKSDNKPNSPLDLAGQLKCPLLGNFGEQDPSIPVSDVDKLRDQLKTGHIPWKVNVYPGASHAFFNDTRPSYNKEAAADAWNETLDFLKAHLHGQA